MEQVSSPTSIPRLHEAGRIGAGRPHTKESRREKPQMIKSHSTKRAVLVNHALASSSRVPNRPKYYFSPRGTLPP
jgi:hypothetical protein